MGKDPEVRGHGGGLAAEGELGQRHGLVGETLRGQDGKGMTWGKYKKENISIMSWKKAT